MEFDFLIVTSWSDFDTKVQLEIVRELEEKGYRTGLITQSDRTAKIVEDVPTETFNLESIEIDEELSPEMIEEYFDISSLRKFCHPEQAYYHLSYEDVLTRATTLAPKFKTIFSNNKFHYSYQGRGGELFRLFVHTGIEANGGTSIWSSFSPFEDTISFSTNLSSTWDPYETIPYGSMTEQEREETTEFMEDFRNAKKRYTYETPNVDIGDEISSHIGRFLSFVKSKIPKPAKFDRPYDLVNSIQYSTKKRVNNHVDQLLLPNISVSYDLCTQNKYVFLPLQFKNESRLTVFEPQFYDQQWLVEYLSRSLPHGIKLFVKQHPNHIGQESPRWISQMTNKTNVDFLNPDLSAHHAIEHAEATIVTNNTAGFEALFYATPLIVLGQVFYGQTPAARNVDNLRSLSDRIAAVIEEGITEKERVSSIKSLREATYHVPSSNKSVDKHAKRMVSSIEEFIDEQI